MRGNCIACSTMGWEQRGNHQYYYRKERHGAHVRSVYVGRGQMARMVSEFQTTSGLFDKVIGRTDSGLEQLKEQDADIAHVCGLIQSITQASLLAAGFHTHKRQWRKKRDGNR